MPKKRGPSTYVSIHSGDDDVTETVAAYAGPYHNFHGIPTTPGMLGYETLTVVMMDETERVFEKDEVIKI